MAALIQSFSILFGRPCCSVKTFLDLILSDLAFIIQAFLILGCSNSSTFCILSDLTARIQVFSFDCINIDCFLTYSFNLVWSYSSKLILSDMAVCVFSWIFWLEYKGFVDSIFIKLGCSNSSGSWFDLIKLGCFNSRIFSFDCTRTVWIQSFSSFIISYSAARV